MHTMPIVHVSQGQLWMWRTIGIFAHLALWMALCDVILCIKKNPIKKEATEIGLLQDLHYHYQSPCILALCISEYSCFLYRCSCLCMYFYVLMYLCIYYVLWHLWWRSIVKPPTIIGLAQAANLYQAMFGSKDICLGLICPPSHYNANLSKKPFG